MFASPLNIWPQIRAMETGGIWMPAAGVFAMDGTVYLGAPNPVIPINDNDDDGWWGGFPSGVLGGLINTADGLVYVESVGYPAVTTPMMASAQIGQHNLGFAIKNFSDEFYVNFGFYPKSFIVVWSQSAIAADLLWREDILPEDGYLHYLKDYIDTIYLFGDPLRAEGISLGNDLAGLPGPGTLHGKPTGGVGGPLDLTAAETTVKNTRNGRQVILSFNNKGDFYGASASYSTADGKVKYSFFKIIMKPGFVDIVEIAEDLFHPIGDVEAGAAAIVFFGKGMNSPHFLYEPAMLWIIQDIISICQTLPHFLGV